MRCDGKHISWHGFHHCSIWTEESKYQLQLNCFTSAKTTVALFISLNLLSLHVLHITPLPWMERRARCPLSIKWYHGIFTKDKLQYTVPGHFDAELALNIIHFSQQPLPNVSQLVTSTASKTNLKHYCIRPHMNRLHPQGLLPLWVVSQGQHFQTKIL